MFGQNDQENEIALNSFPLNRTLKEISTLQTTREKGISRIRKELISIAKIKGEMTYSELLREVGLEDVFKPYNAHYGQMLGEVSIPEHHAGRGMLTALVVRADTRLPGAGFYRLATQLGFNIGNRREFVEREQAKVHQAWSR